MLDEEYSDLKGMRDSLEDKETRFLESRYVARIATCSSSAVPHVSPIYFANDTAAIFFVTEYGTRKFKDISENKRVSLVVDEFDADWLHGISGGTETREKAVVIQGIAEIQTEGNVYVQMYQKLLEKYPDYKSDKNWKPGELPIIRVRINNVVTWGLN